MTRLLATGDLHLEYAEGRLVDQEGILEQIVDVAREREVDGVLIAGDVFHRPKPTPRALHAFARFAHKLEQAAIPVVAILGNAGHDQLGADQDTALELFSFGDWMRVSRHPEVLQLADVSVCTLPSVPVSRLVAAQGGREDVNELAVALLLDTCAEIRAQVPHGAPSVLLGHWSVSGASLPNGLPTSDLHEPVLPVDALDELDFGALVFGHIHRAQILGGAGFYVGSPGCWGFGEASVDHGVWILEATPFGGFDTEFVVLADRRFVTVDADLTEDAQGGTPALHADCDETDWIAGRISEQLPLTDTVIRIRYRATEEQARRVDVQALKGFCSDAGAHDVAQIIPEIVRGSRARVDGVDESLAPHAALDLWLESNIPDETQWSPQHQLLDTYVEATA